VLEILPGVAIDDDDLRFEVSRSSGPGGQNVNKVETRVAVLLDLEHAGGLSDEQRKLVRERLRTRVSRAGVLRVVCQKHRTQGANREAAVERLLELLRAALAPEAPRHPTRPTAAALTRRRRDKELHSRRKAERRARPEAE